MTITKHTVLASVELLIQQRAIQVAHHTSIMEGSEVISGPAVHRQAFAETDNKTAILAEISEYVSADYVMVLDELATTQQQLAQALSENQALVSRVAELEESRLLALGGQPQV